MASNSQAGVDVRRYAVTDPPHRRGVSMECRVRVLRENEELRARAGEVEVVLADDFRSVLDELRVIAFDTRNTVDDVTHKVRYVFERLGLDQPIVGGR